MINDDIDDINKCSRHILDLILSNNISYFVKSLINNYNQCLDNIEMIFKKEIHIQIDEKSSYILELIDLKYENSMFEDKVITVNMALQYKLNYYKIMYGKFKQTIIIDNKIYVTNDNDYHEILKIPIMVGSKFCVSKNENIIYDPYFSQEVPGGFFILKGNKRAISFRSRIRFNQPLIIPYGKTEEDKFGERLDIQGIKCVLFSRYAFEYPFYSYNISILYKDNIFLLNLIGKKDKIDVECNIFTLIKTLSDYTDKDILNDILQDTLQDLKEQVITLISYSLEKSLNSKINDEDLEKIKLSIVQGKRTGKRYETKIQADYLLFCLKKYLRVSLGVEKIESRDSFSKFKVLETTGSLIEELFINYIRSITKSLKDGLITRSKNDLIDLDVLKNIKPFKTEFFMKNFVSSAQWGSSSKTGVCELIPPTGNLLHDLQNLRKFQDTEGKVPIKQKRFARTEYQGFLDSMTTPTSKKVGLIKHLTLLSYVTDYNYNNHFIAMDFVNKYLEELKIEDYKDNIPRYSIFIDGELIIYNKLNRNQILDLDNYLNNLRYKNDTYKIENCHHIDNISFTLEIFTHGGRLVCPMIKLKPNNTYPIKYEELKKYKTLKELSKNHNDIIDLIQIYSVDYIPIGLNMKEINDYINDLKIRYKDDKIKYEYKYIHIDNACISSLPIAMMQFANCQAPVRNLHLAKQCVSSIVKNPNLDNFNSEKTRYSMLSPNIPLTDSHISLYLNSETLPYCLSFFSQIKGDISNQEDAITLNLDFISRGCMLSVVYFNLTLECDPKLGEKFDKPILKNDTSNLNFNKLGPNGVVSIGEYVEYNDVLICKTFYEKNQENNQSIRYKVIHYEKYTPGRVVNIIEYKSPLDQKKYMNVKISQMKYGTPGDKMSSIYGQKGVIGNIYSGDIFGITEYGFTTSLMISPSSMTRLTAGQLKEPLLDYYCLINGTKIFNDSFKTLNINNIRNYMKQHNLDGNCLMRVYLESERVGCLNSTNISLVAYRRQKQLVDKSKVKPLFGEVDALTKQPVEGLKLGTMEVDAYQIYGVSRFLKDTYKYNIVNLCNMCGTIVDKQICPICKHDNSIIKIKIPSATYALRDYLTALGIDMQMYVNPEDVIR